MNIAGTDIRKLYGPGIFLVALVLLATLTLYTSGYTVILVTGILMYVILTMSWVIFSGPTGYISLAPAAFFGVGIYTSAIIGNDFNIGIVVVFGGLASFILAVIVGAITLRLRGIIYRHTRSFRCPRQ